MINAKKTLTAFSQPPDLGRFFNQDGNTANNVKGSANTTEKPAMPITGSSTSPPEALMSSEATIGPVHENDKMTIASAMKNAPI